MFRAFGLFLCLIVAVTLVNALRVSFSVNSNPYSIDFDENNFTVVSMAEKFCRDLADDLNLRTMNDLVYGCISPVAGTLRQEISKQLDTSRIPQGQLSESIRQWVAAATPADTAARAQPAPPQLPTNFRVAVNAGGSRDFVIEIDLNRFTLTSAAEEFCRHRRQELGITSYELLVDACVPQVSNIIRAELSKTYNPDTIPVGELSEDAKAGIAQARAAGKQAQQQQQQQRQTQAQQQAAVQPDGTTAPASGQLQIKLVANSNPYTIVADLSSFTLLTTAETFCRQKARELGVTTMQELVLQCIPSVATHIRNEISTQLGVPAAGIAEGAMSGESDAWFRNYLTEQRAQQAAQAAQAAKAAAEAAQPVIQTAFTIPVPIDGAVFSASFDVRRSLPMAVAEAMCAQEELKLTINQYLDSCVPQVAAYLHSEVNKALAPYSVRLGEHSAAFNQLLARRT